MSKKSEPQISPVMHQLSAYIAAALRKPLPAAVVEKTKHHILDTIAAMVSGSRLAPGKESDRLRQDAWRRQGILVIGSKHRYRRRECRAGQRHARARRRDRRLARAVVDPSRLRHRAGGAGDGGTRAAQRHGAAPSRRARLRRRLPFDTMRSTPTSSARTAIRRTASGRCSAPPRQRARWSSLRRAPGAPFALVHRAASVGDLVLDARRRARRKGLRLRRHAGAQRRRGGDHGGARFHRRRRRVRGRAQLFRGLRARARSARTRRAVSASITKS